MSGQWTNPCGGRRWRTLPNDLIEVEGEGIPAYKPGSAQFNNLSCNWETWGSLIRRGAAQWKLPMSWVLAIMTVETGAWCKTPMKQASIASSATATGLMQIMPVAATQYKRSYARMTEPEENVDTGSQILADHEHRFGHELPRIAAAYNAGPGGGCAARNEWNLKADANYPRQALMYNNAAILYLGVNRSVMLGPALGIAIGLGAAGLALAIALGRVDPRRVPGLRRLF